MYKNSRLTLYCFVDTSAAYIVHIHTGVNLEIGK